MKNTVLALLLILGVSPARAADLDVVRQQYIGFYTAAGADRSAPRLHDALTGLEANTRGITAPGFLLSDGSWSDINYSETPSGTWGPWAHSQRVAVMAKAYQTEGQAFYRSPLLLTQINAALAYEKNFYGATVLPNGNWWFWTMGIPLDLGPTLVLMRNDMDRGTYNDLVLAMQLRIGTSPTTKGIVGPTPTGENLVWSCYTHLALGLLKDDASILNAVGAAMSSVTRPTAGDGIQADSSFHQHGPQLYTGGYGGSFANDVARYALITRGTAYGLAPDALNSFANYVADGIAWSLYGDYFDVSVVGREVARASTSGYNGLAALLQSSRFESSRASEIRAAAAKMLPPWQGTMPVELAAIAVQVEAAHYPAAWPSGHKHYYLSDYTIHRRADWLASVKMFSTRTKSGEDTNNENLLGSRQSDGRFYLVLRGNEYFGRDVWPAFNWSRMPGTTVEQKATTASRTYGFGTNSIAGGTSDGMNGVSAMQSAPLGLDVKSNKAWFFFDDSILFLTNGIHSTSGNPVETIVNQWPLLDDSSQLSQGAGWAALEKVGYWFPSGGDLHVSRETRSGTWAALGGTTDATTFTKSFVTMWFDHGVNPMAESAEYAIVPNVTATQMRDWAAARPLSIVENDQTASAARDNRTGALGIAFWTAGVVDGYQSNSAAVAYITTDGTAIHLWLSDPTNAATGTITFGVPGSYTTKDAPTWRTLRRTYVTVQRAGGATQHIVLTPRSTKRRASRR